MAGDPADIVFDSLNDKGFKPGTVGALYLTDQVQKALTALHAAGWRIVRTSSCQCGDPDIEHGDGTHRLDAYPCEERIVDEWTPEDPR